MTVSTTIDAAGWLSKYLEGGDGDGDLARAMLASFAEVLMSAEASAMPCLSGLCETPVVANHPYGARSEDVEP